MKLNRKKFKDTTVGKILGGTLGLINPVLGGIVEGTSDVASLIKSIKESPVSPEEKLQAQAFILDAYEAEVNDRVEARRREASVAASGGSDWLFKAVGIGIVLSFILVNLAAFNALGEIPKEMMSAFDRAYGAVNAMMVMVVSYYFGSSMSSAQKTHLMNNPK